MRSILRIISASDAALTGLSAISVSLFFNSRASSLASGSACAQAGLPSSGVSPAIAVFTRDDGEVEILADVDGIAFTRFGREDVVRHKLVQRIVLAYAAFAGGGTAGFTGVSVSVLSSR